MVIKEDSLLWYTNVFDKKSSSGSGIANNKTKQNMQLAEELHKPIIRNF